MTPVQAHTPEEDNLLVLADTENFVEVEYDTLLAH